MARLIVGLLVSLFVCSASFALDVPRFYGEEVVVTASRLPRLKTESPWNTSVLSAAELKSFKNIGEALRVVAGADVISYGYLGSLSSVRLRGANSSQVLVLLDGRRINSPTLGMFDSGDLLLDNVERIEVVRAPLSAVYGSDAISGVINIITRSPKEDMKTLSAMTGSFGTQQYKAAFENDKFLLSASQLRSDGFRTNGDYFASNIYGKVVYPLPIGQLFADYDLYDAKKGIPGLPTSEADPASSTQLSDRQSRRNTFASVGLKSDSYQLRGYQNTLNQGLNLATSGVSTNEAWQTGLEWNQNFELMAGKVLYGLEWRQDRGQTTMSGDHTITNVAAYLQDEIELGPQTVLTASFRGDKHSTAGTSFNPRAGLVYQASDDLTLRASAGNAFRAPTLNELYWNESWGGVAGMFGDTNLKPEKSFSYEMGIERQLTRNTSAKLNYFSSAVTDMILWANVDPVNGVYQVKNIGKTQTEGVEFELTRSIGNDGKGFVNYTYQKTIDKEDSNPAAIDKMVPYTPTNKYSIGVISGKTSLIAKFVGERYADSSNAVKLPGYTVVDLNFVKEVAALELNFAVNNLFDERYSEIVGSYNIPGTFTYENRNYPMPGRTYSLGVKWEL